MITPQETFAKPIHATLSNYWLRPWRKLVPRRRAVHRDELCKAERGEAAIRRQHLWGESPDAQRASSKTRQSIVKRNVVEQPFTHLMAVPLNFAKVS